jgi:hypothetical protein
MTESEIIEKVKTTFREWVLGDIEKASKVGTKMGAFILASCFIDYIASYYVNDESGDERYKKFVKDFLKSYDADDLYYSLRNKLVHNYSEGGKYLFTDGKKAGEHLFMVRNKQIINLEDFIIEIKHAMEIYFSELDKNKKLQYNCVKRYNKNPLLELIHITVDDSIGIQPSISVPSASGSTVAVRYSNTKKNKSS